MRRIEIHPVVLILVGASLLLTAFCLGQMLAYKDCTAWIEGKS